MSALEDAKDTMQYSDYLDQKSELKQKNLFHTEQAFLTGSGIGYETFGDNDEYIKTSIGLSDTFEEQA